MKGRFSKLLLTSALAVLLGASMSASAAENNNSNNNNRDRDTDNNRANTEVQHYSPEGYNHGGFGDCGYSYGGGYGGGYGGYGYDNNCCFDNFNNWCDPCCDEPCFSFSVDWLYWDVCQGGLDVALTDPTTLPPTVLQDGETHFFDFDYKSGFRLAASYRLPYDCWALEFKYTHFHPSWSQAFDPPAGGELLPTTIPGTILGAEVVAHADATVRLQYDLYDVLFAKTYGYGDCFKIRPYGGFRAMWLRERFETAYGSPGIAPEFTGLWRVNFPSYGVTLGAEGKYHICGGISAIGHWGTSITGGQVEHHNQWSEATPASIQTETREHCQVVGGWDASLGLAFDSVFCDCPYFFAVGYEIQDWWNMPQRPRFVNDGTFAHFTADEGSRLTLHGLFVRGGFSF